MSDVSINYKGAEIAALDASGAKRLLTSGKYCEGDIEVAYTKPSGGGARTLRKLAEATVSEPVSEIRLALPTGTEEQCDAVLVSFDGLTMSQKDWLYLYANNNTLSSDGRYLSQLTTVTGDVYLALLRPFLQNGNLFWTAFGTLVTTGGARRLGVGEIVRSILFRPYTESTQIVSGTISIWGYVP